MSRPFKHPKTGIFCRPKTVPVTLRQLVDKREELRSLQTRDPEEAKRRFAHARAEIETKWANLRTGSATLTEREAHDLAVVAHDQCLEAYKDNPSEQTFWRTDQAEPLWTAVVQHSSADAAIEYRSGHYRTS